MSTINDQDWELLNAYHDGELDAVDSHEIARRIAGDPHLAAALADIREMSAALKQLRPVAATAPVAKTRRLFSRPMAVAASLAAAIVVAGALFTLQPGEPDTPAAWHADFLAQDYTAPVSDIVQTARLFGPQGAPDLSLANLSLVDQRSPKAGSMALHYAGQNGCRLTLTAGFDVGAATVVQADTLSRFWAAGAVNYMVLATGMDPARFDAIALYIRQLTEQSAQPATVLAMQKATERAVPCSAKA
jgi:hypothetical protein